MRERIQAFVEQYRFLSNFHMEPDGTCVEREYQAAKCADPEDVPRFATLPPAAAKRLGKSIQIRTDWDYVKQDIMRTLVQQKFADHEELRERLLATGTAQLEENNWWGDEYWGICRGVGQNHLGKILMAVRSGLHREEVQ